MHAVAAKGIARVLVPAGENFGGKISRHNLFSVSSQI
jgi:hypothetical protein